MTNKPKYIRACLACEERIKQALATYENFEKYKKHIFCRECIILLDNTLFKKSEDNPILISNSRRVNPIISNPQQIQEQLKLWKQI